MRSKGRHSTSRMRFDIYEKTLPRLSIKSCVRTLTTFRSVTSPSHVSWPSVNGLCVPRVIVHCSFCTTVEMPITSTSFSMEHGTVPRRTTSHDPVHRQQVSFHILICIDIYRCISSGINHPITLRTTQLGSLLVDTRHVSFHKTAPTTISPNGNVFPSFIHSSHDAIHSGSLFQQPPSRRILRHRPPQFHVRARIRQHHQNTVAHIVLLPQIIEDIHTPFL